MMMADDIVVSDSKGKGKSTDPALNEEKKEEDDDDDDEEDDEPVILSGRRKRNVVNYADVRISLIPSSFFLFSLSPCLLYVADKRGRRRRERTKS
jgi:hypothetical protein